MKKMEMRAISYYQTRLRAHVEIIISRVNNLCIHDSTCKKERVYIILILQKHEPESVHQWKETDHRVHFLELKPEIAWCGDSFALLSEWISECQTRQDVDKPETVKIRISSNQISMEGSSWGWNQSQRVI